MNNKDNLKFVIVGHVDHGKSTLIGRLLFDTESLPSDKIEEVKRSSQELGKEMEFAFLMDCLREEREQGITIDTAQTFFKTEKREYVIIDAPGHVEFVKNMITGASQAEAALLIVDVDQGMQEQTKRHAYILSMLGLEQIIVVLNKMDLINCKKERFDDVKENLERFLHSIKIEADFYIPISAMNGDNVAKRSEKMTWYRGPTVLESLDSLKNKVQSQDEALIFPIQDVYKLNGERTAVGRIEAGTFRKGEEIKILPEGQITKVKSIEKFKEKPDFSVAGESIGIITYDPVFLDRGNVICETGKELSLTDTFRANLFWMAKRSFDREQKTILRCATQEISARIEKIEKRINSSTLEILEEDAHQLNNLEVGEVVIKTRKPIAVTTFNAVQELGRFVLMQDGDVCAGGIITFLR